MRSPQTYAMWAERADPACKTCRGLGYAYYRADSEFDPNAREPRENPKFVGACLCCDRPSTERARP